MTNATPPQTEYLTVAEVATLLGLSKMTVYRMCQSGQLACFMTGVKSRTYRILRSSVEQHTTPAAPAPTAGPGQLEIDA